MGGLDGWVAWMRRRLAVLIKIMILIIAGGAAAGSSWIHHRGSFKQVRSTSVIWLWAVQAELKYSFTWFSSSWLDCIKEVETHSKLLQAWLCPQTIQGNTEYTVIKSDLILQQVWKLTNFVYVCLFRKFCIGPKKSNCNAKNKLSFDWIWFEICFLLAHRKVFYWHSFLLKGFLLKGGHRQLSSTFSETPPCSSLQWPTYRNQLSVENHNIENLKMASSRNIEVYYKCFKSSTN